MLNASSIKISFQAHSSVRPLVLYLSVHFHTFRLLSFRLFIRPSIGASVPAFFRPSVRFSLCPFIRHYVQPFFQSSVRAFDVRFVRRLFSCVPVYFAFNYPFVFSSVLSFACDRLTCPFFVQFPICPFIYLVIRLLIVRQFIHFLACLLRVNLSVSFFIRIFISFNRFSYSSLNSFNFPSVFSLIWSFVYSLFVLASNGSLFRSVSFIRSYLRQSSQLFVVLSVLSLVGMVIRSIFVHV